MTPRGIAAGCRARGHTDIRKRSRRDVGGRGFVEAHPTERSSLVSHSRTMARLPCWAAAGGWWERFCDGNSERPASTMRSTATWPWRSTAWTGCTSAYVPNLQLVARWWTSQSSQRSHPIAGVMGKSQPLPSRGALGGSTRSELAARCFRVPRHWVPLLEPGIEKSRSGWPHEDQSRHHEERLIHQS